VPKKTTEQTEGGFTKGAVRKATTSHEEMGKKPTGDRFGQKRKGSRTHEGQWKGETKTSTTGSKGGGGAQGSEHSYKKICEKSIGALRWMERY